MEVYDTLTEAINGLREKGYTYDFNLREADIECKVLKEHYTPADFEVREVYRFEGMSSTGDSSILFALETLSGIKGTLVDSYSIYSVSLNPEMRKKLHAKK